MSDEFEILKAADARSDQFRKTVRNMRGVPDDIVLDPTRAQALVIGPRLWTFVMTSEAVAGWKMLGSKPLTLAVLASGLDRPYLQRILVALPGIDNTVDLEMRDKDGLPLWRGSGTVKDGELEFAMPITRPGVKAEGMMAGRITAKGRLILSDSRLPKPPRKRNPEFVCVD